MNINLLFPLVLCFSASFSLFAQTTSNIQQPLSINTDGAAPAASALLDVKSTDKGVLVPRMTSAQRTAIASPATGLLIFDTNTGGFWFYNGAAWANLSVQRQLADADGDTKIQVEKSTDEDVIRMDLAGSERLVVRTNNPSGNNTMVELPNTGGNVFIGVGTGANNSTGAFNTGIGDTAFPANTSGQSNTAIGESALYQNTTGNLNTAIGRWALVTNSSGDNNTANGYAALYSNTTGFSNVAIGTNALYRNMIRGNLVAVGDSALYNNGAGVAHIYEAMFNTALGSKALFSNTTGYDNTAIGFNALFSNTTGLHNTGNGKGALYHNTTGNSNTALGGGALYSNREGNGNTACGAEALFDNWNGIYNTATGADALHNNTTGNENTAFGYSALSLNTSGQSNAATGSYALYSNTSGNNNTASGLLALYSNTIGESNAATGMNALFNNTTGYRNTACGNNALYSNNSGTHNTAFGYNAYFTADNLDNTTCIGMNSGGISNVSNRVEIGNNSVTWIGGQVGWSTYSDARIKNQVQENVPGLSFITQLRPVTYHLDIHKQHELSFRGKKEIGEWKGMYDIEQKQMTGFIAQEVEAAAKACGYDFSGVEQAADEVGMYSVRYAEFVVPLVKAVQEQQAIIENGKLRMETLEKENKALKAQLDKISTALQGMGVDVR